MTYTLGKLGDHIPALSLNVKLRPFALLTPPELYQPAYGNEVAIRRQAGHEPKLFLPSTRGSHIALFSSTVRFTAPSPSLFYETKPQLICTLGPGGLRKSTLLDMSSGRKRRKEGNNYFGGGSGGSGGNSPNGAGGAGGQGMGASLSQDIQTRNLTLNNNLRIDLNDLRDRIHGIMLVVVDSTVPSDDKTSLELRERIEKIQSILADSLVDLTKIQEHRKWNFLFFRGLNKDRVDRLTRAYEKFQLANQLHLEVTQLRTDLLAKSKAERFTLPLQLNRIEEDAVKQFSQPHNAPHARQDMPCPHHIFYGREVLVKDIISLLRSEKTSRVCITGVGGMGKTSIALAVAEQAVAENIFSKEYVFWVPCIEAKSPDLLRRILYAQLRITAKSYDSLDPLIDDLDVSKQRRLLLLDNFETPWLSGSGKDQAEIGDILVRLAKVPHIALLVTMTSGFSPGRIQWQHRALQALDADAARDVFRTKYRDAAGGLELSTGPELDRLLTAIGHIPLAITLVAACGGYQGASPAALLREWESAGTRMMAGDETRSMDETIRLSMERSVVKSNPEALDLLAILSMLPAGTTGQNLSWWAPTVTSLLAAVSTLRKAALIEFEGDGHFETSRVFVRPTIQSYMAHQDRISAEIRNQVHDACYNFVLRHKSIPDDHKFKADLEALASEEINIQGLLMEIPVDAPRPNAVDALIAFSLYQSRTKPSTVVASHALVVARAVYDNPHLTDCDAAARRVAVAHQALGRSLYMLDRYDDACPYFEEAIAQFKALPGGAELHSAGEAAMDLLDTWMYIRTKSSSELESLSREAQAHLSHDETDKYHVARGLLGFGDFLWWSCRRDEALETLSAAKAIFEHLGCPASTAKCLYYMARTCARQGRTTEALRITKDAVENADQSGEVDLMWHAQSTMIKYLMVQGSYQEASTIFARSLSLAQATGSSLTIAQGLELLAYNSAAMMDLSGARSRLPGGANPIQQEQIHQNWKKRCRQVFG
ncbi:hypothetical protein MSAN_02410000 [Mycena sanguinolenta]|uniref:NACHT domain-containing protein n=1 Tax=Mycena sanguinolenta TaxID=230812 RepID=A0A8H7CDK9_9AGAR|nr:hypothetical protein MSAN_02410000 [Mycena sanguinolenta]